MTKIVRTLSVPENAPLFVVREDVRDDYAVGPSILVCVDVRGVGTNIVYKYAAVSLIDGVLCVNAQTAFEDVWGEVVEA